ncbi:MAG TPA: VOC family protein [Clostridiales bacterium]|nr:VOC family protein [Clostridiales bacterium]
MAQMKWVTLHVADMQRSLDFYGKLLGMSVTQHITDHGNEINMMDPGSGAWVELLHREGETVNDPGQGISFGLQFDDVEAVVAKVKDAGVEVAGPISPNPHLKFYFINDPDGYTIQLL